MTILFDTSAVIDLASRSDGTDACNELSKLDGLVFVFAPSVTEELFGRLYENPFDQRGLRNIAFVRALTHRTIPEEPLLGVWAEILGTRRSKHAPANPKLVQHWENSMRQAEIGAFDTTRRALRMAIQRNEQKQQDEFHQGVRAVRGKVQPTFTEFCSEEQCLVAAATVAESCCAQLRRPYPLNGLRAAARAVVHAPRTVPYLSGLARITMFSNWHAHRKGKTGGQADLRNIQTSLNVDVVCAQDKQLRDRGAEIFPEATWITVNDLLERRYVRSGGSGVAEVRGRA